MKYIRIEQPSVLALRYNRNPKISLDDINYYNPTKLHQFANKLIELATTDKVLDYFKLCCNYDPTIFITLLPFNKQKVVNNVSVDDIPFQLFRYYSIHIESFLYEINNSVFVPNDWYKQIIKYANLTKPNTTWYMPDKYFLWRKNELLLLKYAPEFNPDLYVQIKYIINNNILVKLDIEEYKQNKEPYNKEVFTNEQKDILRLYLTPANYNELVLGLNASNYDNITDEEIFDLFS